MIGGKAEGHSHHAHDQGEEHNSAEMQHADEDAVFPQGLGIGQEVESVEEARGKHRKRSEEPRREDGGQAREAAEQLEAAGEQPERHHALGELRHPFRACALHGGGAEEENRRQTGAREQRQANAAEYLAERREAGEEEEGGEEAPGDLAVFLEAQLLDQDQPGEDGEREDEGEGLEDEEEGDVPRRSFLKAENSQVLQRWGRYCVLSVLRITFSDASDIHLNFPLLSAYLR